MQPPSFESPVHRGVMWPLYVPLSGKLLFQDAQGSNQRLLPSTDFLQLKPEVRWVKSESGGSIILVNSYMNYEESE